MTNSRRHDHLLIDWLDAIEDDGVDHEMAANYLLTVTRDLGNDGFDRARDDLEDLRGDPA